MHRRNFIGRTVGFAAAVAAQSSLPIAHAAVESTEPKYPLAIFGKVFKTHSFDQLADALVTMNADGVEATIRSGGHIEPKQADEQVPKLVDALAKRGKRVLIAASDVTSPDTASQQLLKTLRDNGIAYYRMGHYKYRSGKPLKDQVESFAKQARDLAVLNQELGVVGLYQNHAGVDYVGSLIWDMVYLLDNVPVEHLGVALDLRHLRVEIGNSYMAAVNAIRPHLRSVFMKDALAVVPDVGRPKSREVALGKGMVNRELFRDVWKSVKPAPLSIHVEYFGQDPIPPAKADVVVDAYRNDVQTLRSWMS